MVHITAADNKFEPVADAFFSNGPDFAFLIDANAHLIAGPNALNGATFFNAGPGPSPSMERLGLLQANPDTAAYTSMARPR
jgi:hypothetical protein